MSSDLLLKGFEVEMYTGRPDGTVVGCAAEAAQALADFVTEPDNRNLEYTTAPEASYRAQLRALLEPRQRLRQWLGHRGLTLLPGSTLSLGDSHRFERSDPGNPYHGYIEQTYGTRVVTASVHINLGMEAMEPLFAAIRMLRCEGSLLLALSASSPFLDGAATGAHSQRWLQFPLTPPSVPLFRNHLHYIEWMEEQLAAGSMQNVRHLWTGGRSPAAAGDHGLCRTAGAPAAAGSGSPGPTAGQPARGRGTGRPRRCQRSLGRRQQPGGAVVSLAQRKRRDRPRLDPQRP
jgi:predicted glutamate--cysteine ligase